MFREALAGLPTRPVLYLSAVVLALGLGYQLVTTYSTCNRHADMRERLRDSIAAGVAGGNPVRLARVTDFDWDLAEILVNYKPGGRVADCPFGWDWSREQREALVAGDLLTVIVFLRDGRLVDYLEYRNDQAKFVDVENPYTPQSAVFVVSPSPGASDALILSPAK